MKTIKYNESKQEIYLFYFLIFLDKYFKKYGKYENLFSSLKLNYNDFQ